MPFIATRPTPCSHDLDINKRTETRTHSDIFTYTHPPPTHTHSLALRLPTLPIPLPSPSFHPYRYGYSSVAYNFVISALTIQWAMLISGFWAAVEKGDFSTKVGLQITDLIKADFAAAAVMISFGAVLGKVSPTQMFLIMVIEIFVFGLACEIICIASTILPFCAWEYARRHCWAAGTLQALPRARRSFAWYLMLLTSAQTLWPGVHSRMNSSASNTCTLSIWGDPCLSTLTVRLPSKPPP